MTQNKGPGQWIDFWVICDTATCYLFFSDDNGHIYRAQTTLANFPNGFGNTQIVLTDSRFALFEATNVYKIATRTGTCWSRKRSDPPAGATSGPGPPPASPAPGPRLPPPKPNRRPDRSPRC